METYKIQHTTLSAIADSIRSRTGSTEPIAVVDMATAIGGITGGGGGSAEGCVTVTFMNGDTVLFTRPVYIGDDCPDPWVQKRIETPTKESTAQYDYTFNGWSATDGGAADSNALKGITEDKTLYAAFAVSARMYTVRFYDGDTLLHTEQVAYGGSSEYVHQKGELMFNGWTPTPTNIVGDMDCYGEWIDKPNFATSSWETIAAISESGQAADTFSVGDERDITVTYADGTTEVVTLQIAGFNQMATDVESGGILPTPIAPAGITMVTKYALNTPQRLYKSNSTNSKYTYKGAMSNVAKGGTSDCELYNWIHTDFLNALPSDFLAVLKPQLAGMYTDTSTFTSVPVFHKVSIPHSMRITGATYEYSFGTSTIGDYLDAPQFTLFKTTSNVKKTTRDGTSVSYWLADYFQMSSGGYYYRGVVVQTNGTISSSDMTGQHHVLPMFSI